MNERSRNEAELEGIVLSDPVFSHENHGVRFDRFVLRVPRLSGQEDLLPVLAGESLCASIREGAAIRVFGQLRSFNNRTGQGSRLVLTIYAKSILSSTGASPTRFCSPVPCASRPSIGARRWAGASAT